MDKNLLFYQQNTGSLIEQYDSVSFESVHKDWLEFLPKTGNVLDIGAGSGRDARYMSELGLKVYAVEPVLSLLKAAKENSSSFDIEWYQDTLPNLEHIKAIGLQFDLILLSAVWMHLSSSERALSMKSMSALLGTGGRLVISLRYGDFTDGRTAYPLNAEEVLSLASENGLKALLITEAAQDKLGRGEVIWQTVVLGN